MVQTNDHKIGDRSRILSRGPDLPRNHTSTLRKDVFRVLGWAFTPYVDLTLSLFQVRTSGR